MKKNIGILVSAYLYNKIQTGIETNECIPFYEEACAQYGLTPCFFRLADLTKGKKHVKSLVKDEHNRYSFKVIKTPMIIHNRVLLYHRREQEKIVSLLKEGIKFYNAFTKISKLTIHQYLEAEDKFKCFLPETRKTNKNNFLQMINLYEDLIIKPNYGTLGKGITRIMRHSDNVCLVINGKKKYNIPLNGNWASEVNEIILNPTNIIQQRIQLGTYEDKPFDFRVSVQKNELGNWQVTGIVCKVANLGKYTTNVASGGRCYDPKIVLNHLKMNTDDILAKIRSLSLKIAQHLDGKLTNLADLGLDIGITEKGIPMFIECNFRDLRITFKEAGLFNEWKATYFTPIKYANFLINNIEDKD
ncbi:YheC/YheD family protein [Metabacillus niabensis]|uniref:YheC/YheD family protein n=1 Tax=Metabacillus niabensis TaxID=324854 RepID=UPI001CFA9DB3|nr:YheC/YheD family protein [Metabacillus niabensis]